MAEQARENPGRRRATEHAPPAGVPSSASRRFGDAFIAGEDHHLFPPSGFSRPSASEAKMGLQGCQEKNRRPPVHSTNSTYPRPSTQPSRRLRSLVVYVDHGVGRDLVTTPLLPLFVYGEDVRGLATSMDQTTRGQIRRLGAQIGLEGWTFGDSGDPRVKTSV